MTERGAGDEGAAVDLARTADEDVEPKADWSALWPLLAELVKAAPDARAGIVARARAAANGNAMALSYVDDELKGL